MREEDRDSAAGSEELGGEETMPEATPPGEPGLEETPPEEAPPEPTAVDDAAAADQPAAEEAPAEDAPSEAAPAEDAPAEDAPAEEAPSEESSPEETPPEDPAAEDAPAGEASSEESSPEETPPEGPAGEDAPPEEAPAEEPPRDEAEPERPEPPRRAEPRGEDRKADEAIPGADLEPDLVLDAPAAEGEYGEYPAPPYEPESEPEEEPDVEPEEAPERPEAPVPVARTPLDLAADARYRATGKRKTSVARVILKPGDGTYTVNGRSLETFFPRVTLQKTARQPLETAGYASRMDVVAKIHGGGVSAQASALRHGVARALVEADPNLRGELKRRGFLTRDPRVKERKKAGLKKARKRPQFSKR